MVGPRTQADVWQAGCHSLWQEAVRGCGGGGEAKRYRELAAEGHLRLDTSAVIGERGQRAALSRCANEQLVRGRDRVIVRSARVRGRVARGGHDHDLCAS